MIGFTLVRVPKDMKVEWFLRVESQGKTVRRDATPITYAQVERAGRMYLSGFRVPVIATTMNTTPSRVYKILQYTGMPKWMKQMNTYNCNRRDRRRWPVGVNRYMWNHL